MASQFPKTIDTLVIGAGQAGVAMSAHLTREGVPHIVLERARIAERWRSERWDSLVANGPAWHDRFPAMEFEGMDPDIFVPKEQVADYFETFAARNKAPVHCGVTVTSAARSLDGGFTVETSHGTVLAKNLVSATGPFQKPLIPTAVPETPGLMQIHSNAYRNPGQLPKGAVLVVGAGSSGAQIADELVRAGKRVFLSVGPHDRPPRAYRGHDFVWWLGKLGKWDMKAPTPGTEHVTISVSGAYGGATVDFRNLAARGITLLGRTGAYQDGVLQVAGDLALNIRNGDANYLSVLQEADAYAAAQALDLPLEPDAHKIGPMPDCVENPLKTLDLKAEGIIAIVWATGFSMDYGWLKLGKFDEKGRPEHTDGVSPEKGLYFVGLPWLSCRGSAFIWGSWRDAERLAGVIAGQ